MVAFELAQLEEVAGQIERATKWYHHAWDRFRRAEWKKRAEEALGRLGAPIPTSTAGEEPPQPAEQPELSSPSIEFADEAEPEPPPQPAPEPEVRAGTEQAAARPPAGVSPGAHRRRRGGRGRGRGRGQARTEAPGGHEPVKHEPESPHHPAPHVPAHPAPIHATPVHPIKEPEPQPVSERRPAREHAPSVHVYRRVGEPALASVIAGLEAKLRQLLAAHAYEMEHVDEAPASPGVYMVSDLDLTTVYYVEAYGNMRVAMEQLVSGRRGRQGSVRARLAQYLGIGDSQATRYLKQHCVVRWLELEESDAVALCHFATGVFRPELNEEES